MLKYVNMYLIFLLLNIEPLILGTHSGNFENIYLVHGDIFSVSVKCRVITVRIKKLKRLL